MQYAPDILSDSPFGADKLYMSVRAYTIFLQGFFAAWERYRWDSDPEISKIAITQSAPFAPPTESKFPVIILASNGASWVTNSPNNVSHAQDIFDDNAPQAHANLAQSSMSIYAIGSSDTEAALIGWNIFNAIPAMRNIIQKLGGPQWISHLPTLSAPFDASALIEGAQEGQWFATMIQSPFVMSQEVFMLGNPFLLGAIDKIRIIAESVHLGDRVMDV